MAKTLTFLQVNTILEIQDVDDKTKIVGEIHRVNIGLQNDDARKVLDPAYLTQLIADNSAAAPTLDDVKNLRALQDSIQKDITDKQTLSMTLDGQIAAKQKELDDLNKPADPQVLQQANQQPLDLLK